MRPSKPAQSNAPAEVVPVRRSTLYDHAAAAVKVILLSGGLLAGLWLLQTVAQK